MCSKTVNEHEQHRHYDLASQLIDAPDISYGLDEFLHLKLF